MQLRPGHELTLLDNGKIFDSVEDEIRFTLMAERYERRSLRITSNLVFAEWDRIFKNPMTTAAAIDRLVHHSAILEFSGPSKRADETPSSKRSGSCENMRGHLRPESPC